MTGWRNTLAVWPGLLMCGVSFACFQFYWSNFHDSALVDITGRHGHPGDAGAVLQDLEAGERLAFRFRAGAQDESAAAFRTRGPARLVAVPGALRAGDFLGHAAGDARARCRPRFKRARAAAAHGRGAGAAGGGQDLRRTGFLRLRLAGGHRHGHVFRGRDLRAAAGPAAWAAPCAFSSAPATACASACWPFWPCSAWAS